MAVRVICGDALIELRKLPAESVHCCVTSPNDGRFKPGQHWRPPQAFREAAWLLREYSERGRSTGDIAAEFGVTDSAIIFWLRRHDIPRRNVSQARALKHWGADGAANPMFGRVGAANPRYIDGSSPERQRLYSQAAGRAFVAGVLKRDGYRCRRCGDGNRGRRLLHAHHIKPWAGNPSLRLDPENALTLCRPCHSWVHSNANTEGQFLA